MFARVFLTAVAGTLITTSAGLTATIGYAVSGPSGSPVGIAEDYFVSSERRERQALSDDFGYAVEDVISYFIPLDGSIGPTCTFGVDCGTTSDFGAGGTTMDLWVRFEDVEAGTNRLDVTFADLDLAGVNDPFGFFERVEIFDAFDNVLLSFVDEESDTGVNAGASNNDTQVLLSFDIEDMLEGDFYAKFQFSAFYDGRQGQNTAEFMVAVLTSMSPPVPTFDDPPPPPPPSDDPPLNVVPLPAAGWLLLGGLAGLFAMRRRKS